jgi:hypothetical protein
VSFLDLTLVVGRCPGLFKSHLSDVLFARTVGGGFVPSSELLEALAGLEAEVQRQAVASLGDTLSSMTGPEKEAAVLDAELALLTGELDYSQTRLKAELLHRLNHRELWRFHPSSPASLAELLTGRGISNSEASDLIAWEQHIYPYLSDQLRMRPFEVWQQVGKTKMRKLTPFLRHLIDDEFESPSAKVRQGVERLFWIERQRVLGLAQRQLIENAEPMGVPLPFEWSQMLNKLLDGEALDPDEQQELIDTYTAEFLEGYDEKKEVVRSLIEAGGTLSLRHLGEHVSPEPTPAIEAVASRYRQRVVDENGQVSYELRYRIELDLTEDQLTLLRRRFPDRLDLTVVDEPSTAGGETV